MYKYNSFCVALIVPLMLGAITLLSCTPASDSETTDGPPPLVVDTSEPLLLDEPTEEQAAAAVTEAATENMACFVCHANYMGELLAESHAKALERERHYSVISNVAKAKLLRAGIASTRGDMTSALDYLSFAIDKFDECGSAFWHAVSLRRQGQMLGGEEGQASMRKADDWMANEGIKNPARMTAAFIPGFPLGKEGRQTLRVRTPLGMRKSGSSPDDSGAK